MERPLISCIVPVFNGELYVGEALDSVLGQTYRPLEVIVVDDGSTDGTARIVAGYGERVSYLAQSNAGHAAARNRGIHAARGDFVAFLDADDLWHPEKLTRQLDCLLAQPLPDLCFTHLRNFWMPRLGKERDRFNGSRYARPFPGFSTVTLLARSTVFERIGPFNPSLRHGDDTEWFLRAADRGIRREMLAEVLVYRRIHQTNRSRSLAAESRDEYLHILKDRLDGRRRAAKQLGADGHDA
jgi:glycosyltransferase involved in cell wall biosynthesis